jgi:hypothetical protein
VRSNAIYVMLETKTVTNGPTAKRPQRVCHSTLPWLISFSLDLNSPVHLIMNS